MKKYIVLFSLCLLIISFSSCSHNETSPKQSYDRDTDFSDSNVDIYIGLDVDSAQRVATENNTTLRVVEQDGTPLPATMDYRPGRINAVTQDGVVVSYTIE